MISAPMPPPPPRQIAELATLGRRLAALLYEGLLLLGVLALTYLIPNLLLGIFFGVAEPGWLGWIHIYLVLGAYFLWYWVRGGQTLAMQTWKLKLVEAGSGRCLSPGRACLRYTLAWPSVVSGLGVLWAVFDSDGQFLHDRLAGTRLVLLLPDSA